MIQSEDIPRRATVLCYKSFGDFVIAAASVEQVDNRRGDLSLAIGSYLGELASALDISGPVTRIALRESGVPSIFDLRRNGVARGWRSLRNLRAAVKNQVVDTEILVIDRSGWRERSIALGLNWMALPKRPNIYLAYRSLLEDLGYSALPAPVNVEDEVGGVSDVGIFPGSRLAAKNFPLDLIRSLMTHCNRQRLNPVLFTLADERPDIERSDLPHRVVPRNFRAMVEAISDVARVISADSMPAHIAEQKHRPVFVFSPISNSYWLPLSAFQSGNWELFSTSASSSSRLDAFLS